MYAPVHTNRSDQRRFMPCRLGTTLAITLAAALAPQSAWAEFGPPTNLSRAGQDSHLPQVAMNARGDALVVWWRRDLRGEKIQARARSAAGEFGPIEVVSPHGEPASSPKVAIRANGDALIVWASSDGGSNTLLKARARSAAGTFGPVHTLSPAGQDVLFYQVAMDADGDALVVWLQQDRFTTYRRVARPLSAAGMLGPQQGLSPAHHDGASAPLFAMDAHGRALIVWPREDRIQGRSRSSAGVLGPIRALSLAGRNVGGPHPVAMNAKGDALVAWTRRSRRGGAYTIEARARPAAGVFGPIEMLHTAELVFNCQIAISASGDGLFVWEIYDGSNRRIQARARSALGVLGPVQNLSPPGQVGSDPKVVMNGDGSALVVWQRWLDGVEPPVQVQARTRSADGILGPVQTLSQPVQDGSYQQAATDGRGRALVVWRHVDRMGNVRVQAVDGP
jgi:hypothetical protein